MKPISRRQVLKLIGLTTAGGVLGACAPKATPTPTSVQPTTVANLTQTITPTTVANLTQTITPQALDPLGRYKDTLVINVGRSLVQGKAFPKGDTIDSNYWTRAYLDVLNTKVNYLWVADPAQHEEKVNLAIASNDIPDVFEVTPNQFKTLAANDMIADLTDAYNTYASPLVKQQLEGFKLTLPASKINGKLMGLPYQNGPWDNYRLLWVRTDWLKKLNLTEPKTMQDVYKIAQAFTENDPDGDGKANTYGLGLNNELYGDFCSLQGFASGFHAYPGIWVKDSSGQKLVYGSIQPETKSVLAELAKMYASHWINPEFATMDGAKSADAFNASKGGMFYGPMWSILFPINGAAIKSVDPEAEWQAYALVSNDDKPAKTVVMTESPYTYVVVRKGFEHPEAMIKLENIFLDRWTNDNANLFPESIPIWDISAVHSGSPNANIQDYRQVSTALKTNDTSGLGKSAKQYYDGIIKYQQKGNFDYWTTERVFGITGSLSVVDQYLKDESTLVQYNEFFGLPTASMPDTLPVLKSKETETFINIIVGTLPIDAFDQFVIDWNQLFSLAKVALQIDQRHE